jgi:hypothetical protein
LTDIVFIHANITDIAFRDYDAFYFFNAFYENMHETGKMDDDIPLNQDLYTSYSLYVKEQLAVMPIGTKLATYFSYLKEIPDNYALMKSDFDNKLKMWKKIS